MPEQIGAYDAKTRLPELLRKVLRGERFTITHRGKPIADLVPSGSGAEARVAEAIDDMLRFKKIRGVDAGDIKAWVEEGRK